MTSSAHVSIAAALISGSDREADLALAGVIGARQRGTIADQLPGRAQHHGEPEPFPWRIGVPRHFIDRAESFASGPLDG